MQNHCDLWYGINDEHCKRWKRGFDKQPAGMIMDTVMIMMTMMMMMVMTMTMTMMTNDGWWVTMNDGW